MNLKIKSITLVALCFITILAVSYGFLQFFSRDIRAGVATMYAKEQVNYNRLRVLQPLQQELILARKLAHSATIKNWLSNESNPELRTAALTELEDYRQFFSDHSYFCAIRESGHYYFNDKDNNFQNSELRYTLNPSEPNDFWFFRTLKNDQGYDLNVDYDEKLKVTKVWINTVVRDNTHPIGIIGTGIDLSDFINSVIVSERPGVTNFFIDESGAIQAHSQESYIDFRTISKSESERKTIFQHLGTQQDTDALRAAILRLQSGPDETEVITARIDGSEYLVGIGAIHEIGWYNVTLLDTASIIGPQHTRPFSLLLFIALLLLSAILTFLFNRFVVQRINRLNHLIQKYTQGDEVVFPAESPQDEIGRLETSFQQMTAALQEHTEKLEGNVAEQTSELTEKNIQLNTALRSIQRIKSRGASLNEITKDYLTRGDLEQSLELLVAKAAKFVGAQAGRFLHCLMKNGEIKVTSVSNMCWSTPSTTIEDPQAQEAFEKYAQTLMQSGGQLLISTLKNHQTIILTGEQYLASRSIPLPAGHPEIESLMLTPISIKGEILGVIALANCPGGFSEDDKAGLEAFAAEAAILIHADSRETARSAAEETARLRNAFLANMSHELRTPLNIIIGMNQLLQGMKHPKEQQNYLEKIGFSAKQLLALIDDVLDIAKISEGGEIVLKESSFQPDELFYSTSQLLAFRQDNRKAELHADIDRELPPFLFGDTRRLTQILNNMLSNALKFTPKGSVTLRVSLLNRTEDQVTLSFSVTDTGIGIGEEQMENVFQPFFQIDSTSTRQQSGSGLGLAISRQLCQLMGGELSVESTLGQGSTFHFELPFKIDATAERKTKFSQSTVDLNGMSILIVNSCPACCAILPQMLEALQFKTASVTSASGALMLLNNAIKEGNPYQIVLIGLFLDEMSGSEFAEQLTDQVLPDTQKILLANPADIANLSEQMTTLDLAGLVSIPASPADLFNVIANAFEHASAVCDQTTGPPAQWQQVKVLLVDDNEMGREMGRALLENVGIEVYEAVDGLEAVDRVETEDFDLVLMDVQMPVLDGLSATRAIRNLDKVNIENLPIIAMTAHSLTEHRVESLAAGMNGHLTKPINLETLYAALQLWLPREKQQFTREAASLEVSEYADLETALPGVDVKAGIRRVVGDQQLYISLLKKYLDQFSTTEKELHQELELNQQEEAIRRVHTLQGVAGSLGATQLQKLTGQLEAQLTQEEHPSTLDAMLVEHNKFLNLLQHLPELNQSQTAVDKTTGSESEVQALLKQILVPLTGLQAQEINPILARIQEKQWPEKYRNQLLQLAELVDRYQFNLATELVQGLLQQSES